MLEMRAGERLEAKELQYKGFSSSKRSELRHSHSILQAR